MSDKCFKSVGEYERAYFPNSQLQRLERTLCSALGLDKDHQHRRSVSDDDPNTGSIEVARPPVMFTGIDGTVAGFYREEGYTISVNQDTRIMTIKKDKKEYWIHIGEGETSYTVNILQLLTKHLKNTLEDLADSIKY